MLACRFGGDEFYLLGIGINADEAQKIILRIQKYLEHYNDNNSKAYRITVSGGYASVASYSEDALDAAFSEADRNMYHQKELRHSTHT